MAKRSESNIYIEELDLTIKRNNYYMPEFFEQGTKADLLIPILTATGLTVVALMEGTAGLAAVLFAGGGAVAFELIDRENLGFIYDPHRLAYDFIKAKIFGQSENGDHNSSDYESDLAGATISPEDN